MQAGIGPFGMMDRIGLGVVYHLAELIGGTKESKEALEYARYIDETFIQNGHLGVASDQGFYRHPKQSIDVATRDR